MTRRLPSCAGAWHAFPRAQVSVFFSKAIGFGSYRSDSFHIRLSHNFS